MKSRFSFSAFMPLVLCAGFAFLLYFSSTMFTLQEFYDQDALPVLLIPGGLLIIYFFVLLRELRIKVVSVEFGKYEIKVKNFLGLVTRNYNKNEIEGWKTSFFWTNMTPKECIFFYKNGKKIFRITELHHRNYFDLKKLIESEYRFLGTADYSYW